MASNRMLSDSEKEGILIEDQNKKDDNRGSGKRRLITVEYKCKLDLSYLYSITVKLESYI